MITAACSYSPQTPIPIYAENEEQLVVKNTNNDEECEILTSIKAAKELKNTMNINGSDMLLYNHKILKMRLNDFDPVKALKKAGFYKNESKDEKLNLRNAIIRFQSSINEPVSGELSDLDLQIIDNSILACSNSLPSLATDEINAYPTDKLWIVINKTTRILTLYEGGKTIKKYPIAPGLKPSYTPEGKFSIVTMIKNPGWGGGGYTSPVKGGSPSNPLGYRWMGLSPKGGGVYGIHGNNKPYSIGTNASHGCIRMINSDVEELFDMVSVSTIVWIGTDELLMEWGVSQQIYHI